MKLSEIRENPDNPRIIKSDKFKKLVASISQFPEMLEARPIVVDPNMFVLGGNMRLKACRAAGIATVPVYVAGWDEVKSREFIIKDNASFGEWDWDMLANNWEIQDLSDWGIDIPASYFDSDVEPQFDINTQHEQIDSYLNNNIKQITLYFDNDQYQYVVQRLESLMATMKVESNTDVILNLLRNV